MKRLKLISLLAAICFCLMFLSSCMGPIYRIRSSGYFRYMVHEETNEAMLVGLTKSGMEQETIVIPSQINGHKLSWLGYPSRPLPYWSTSYEIDFKSEKLKKLYIPSTIKLLVYASTFYEGLPNLEEFYWGSVICNKTEYLGVNGMNDMIFEAYTFYDYRHHNENFKNGYVSQQHMLRNKEAVYDKSHSSSGKNYYSYMTVANVVYYLSDNPEDTYFVDNCDNEKIINIPDNPIKEGYKFMGWYKEKECINKWDFERDIVPKKKYNVVTGEYILNETSLYAKWED